MNLVEANFTSISTQPSIQQPDPRGFYRRRRGILDHLQSGLITLFDASVHDFVCLNAQSRVGMGSGIPGGVWFGSARKIFLLTGRRESERQIQRSLSKLERLGWLKRFRLQGQRGDYAILVARFIVTDRDKGDFKVNAEETTDWRRPVFEPVVRLGSELTLKRQGTVTQASPLLPEFDIERNEDLPAPTHAPSQQATALANLLKERILGNDPKANITPRQHAKWAQSADLLMRLDGRTAREVRDVIVWCQEDPFWKSNILSMGKLRSKFPQLFLKQQSDANGEPHERPRRTAGKAGAVTAPAGKYDCHNPDFVIVS
jgi:hypothetical protein